MHDLVTLGEVLLRLAVPSPARFETAKTLDVQIGGAEANVAAACARLGLRTAWVSAVPANAWGDRVRRELGGHGVDCSRVVVMEGTRLGTYFLEYGVAPRPIRVLYDRRDSAFARLTPDAVDWDVVRQARVIHTSGVTAALGANGRALVRRAAEEAAVFSYDINFRSALWSVAEARACFDELLPRAKHVFLGESEARVVCGLDGPAERTLETLAKRAPGATVALLRGAEGSLVAAAGKVFAPRIRPAVHVIDPVGAGDAYVAGFLWALLRGDGVAEAVDAGTAVAALKCSTWGDIGLVTPEDVDDVLGGGPDMRR